MATVGLVDYDDLFEVLKEMTQIFKEQEIKWCLCLNSVLGAVRSNDFVKIQDVCISVHLFEVTKEKFNTLIEIFKEHGFEAVHIYGTPGLFRRGRSGIEIHRIGKKGNYYYNKHFMYHEKFFDSFSKGNIRGFEVPLPNHPEELLEVYYGESWRIPQKNVHGLGNVAHKRCVERFEKGI